MIHENCGVVGVFSLAGHNVIPFVVDTLRALQHRGQESWGLAVPHKPPLKRLGLVSAAAPEFQTIIKKFNSKAESVMFVIQLWVRVPRKCSTSEGKRSLCCT